MKAENARAVDIFTRREKKGKELEENRKRESRRVSLTLDQPVAVVWLSLFLSDEPRCFLHTKTRKT